ncbi:MAG: SH3 domain-containing protein [Nitrospinales bacterium]
MPTTPTPRGKPRRPATAAETADHCSACGWPLRGALYCRRCGPPRPPPRDYEEESLANGKTFTRIALMVLLFVGVAMLKLDVKIDLFGTEPNGKPAAVPESEKPRDEDFKVVHLVNVSLANVRKRPSPRGRIVMVLEKDTRVQVLEEKGKWLRISAHDKTGWIYGELVTARVE